MTSPVEPVDLYGRPIDLGGRAPADVTVEWCGNKRQHAPHHEGGVLCQGILQERFSEQQDTELTLLREIRDGQAQLIDLINSLVSRSPMAKLLLGRGKNG